MSRFKSILVGGLCLFLQGCLTLPQSASEFKSGKYSFQVLCSQKSVEDTHALLRKELIACYARTGTTLIPAGGVYMYGSSGTGVEEKVLSDGTSTLSLPSFQNGGFKGYQQLIEIYPTNECPANVKVYELTSMWKKHTERVRGWLAGEEATGCGIW